MSIDINTSEKMHENERLFKRTAFLQKPIYEFIAILVLLTVDVLGLLLLYNFYSKKIQLLESIDALAAVFVFVFAFGLLPFTGCMIGHFWSWLKSLEGWE